MAHADFRELLVAIAGSAGALTGLLFVAMSVAPRRNPALAPRIIQQVRAAAALLAFTNALAVSLFGLVPQGNIGYSSMVLAGLSPGSSRSRARRPSTRRNSSAMPW
jgi:hypothetical protein